MQIIFSEKELEDFLCKENNLKKYLDLEFVARQVSIPPAGIVDILAYHKESKSWVVIELKKDLLDLSALAQGMSYLKYFQDVRKFNPINRRRTRNYALLLIGHNLDKTLHRVVSHNSFGQHFMNNNIYYKLFGLDLDSGINFDFYDSGQEDYDYKLQECLDLQESKAHDFLSSKPSGFF